MKRGQAIALGVFILAAFFTRAVAHEIRPALLQITEIEANRFDILWKRPVAGDRAVRLIPHISGGLIDGPPSSVELSPDAEVSIWLGVEGSLEGAVISVDGLDRTITDVLLSVHPRTGGRLNAILGPENPTFEFDHAYTIPATFDYAALGVEHILTGADHLLFVFGLLLLLQKGWPLLQTITAFTIAHSITLSLATLGMIEPNSGIIEALVALSIVFVAVELVRRERGRQGLSLRRPWLIAFAFGLLHGTAFGGELVQIGLPPEDIPLALFLFNLGIEIGQILFLAFAMGVLILSARAVPRVPQSVRLAPAYAIGGCAAFWFIQRLEFALF